MFRAVSNLLQSGMAQSGYGGFNNMQPQQSEMMETGNPSMMSGGQFQQPGSYQGTQPMASTMGMQAQPNYMGQQQQLGQHFTSTSQ